MAAMVCKACQDYAAQSGSELCGNCVLLSPEDLAKATKDGAARAAVKGKPVDQMAMLAQLQQENAQLKAAHQQSAQSRQAPEKKQEDDHEDKASKKS